MEKHKGKLLSAFEPNESESTLPNIDEVHYLEFPNLEAFENYRGDSELNELTALRSNGISKTTIIVSGEHVVY